MILRITASSQCLQLFVLSWRSFEKFAIPNWRRKHIGFDRSRVWCSVHNQLDCLFANANTWVKLWHWYFFFGNSTCPRSGWMNVVRLPVWIICDFWLQSPDRVWRPPKIPSSGFWRQYTKKLLCLQVWCQWNVRQSDVPCRAKQA
jgi:hypothetical protein